MKSLVNYQEIEKAYNRISKYATKTPLLSSDLLNKEFSSKIIAKLSKIGTNNIITLNYEFAQNLTKFA